MSAAKQWTSGRLEGGADEVPRLELERAPDGRLWIWRPTEQVEVEWVRSGVQAFARPLNCDGRPMGEWRLTKLSEAEENAAWEHLRFEAPPEPNGEDF